MRNVVVLRISVVSNNMKSKAQLSESHRKVAQAFVFIPQNFFCNTLKVMRQSIPPTPSAPPPPTGGYCGHLPTLSVPGVGHLQSICQPRGHSRAFDTHAVSYQNITTQRVLLEKRRLAHLSRTGIN